MSVERRAAAFYDLAAADLDAAEILARIGNHYAAYHIQQAVEKLLKSLLLLRGVEAGTEHRLSLPDGRVVRAPPGAEVLRDVTAVRDLVGRARADLAVLKPGT